MCRVTVVTLESPDCSLAQDGQNPHQFRIYKYSLCQSARDSNDRYCEEPQIDEQTSGSRTGRCRVCENIRRANEEYDEAMRKSTFKVELVRRCATLMFFMLTVSDSMVDATEVRHRIPVTEKVNMKRMFSRRWDLEFLKRMLV